MLTNLQGNPLFDSLYANPTLHEMLKLAPRSFEKFVTYIFHKAGFTTSDVALRFIRGVDIEIYHPIISRQKSGGIEIKRYNPDHLVGAPTVQKLMGAPAVRGNTPAYLITTSNFNNPAIQMANTNNKVRLINGEQWLRYIEYISGSVPKQTVKQGGFISPDAFSHSFDIKNIKPFQTKVIVIGNNKGGVGKSTTAEYLAHAFAQSGKRTLLIDFDPQANLSDRILGLSTDVSGLPHLEDYFFKTVNLDQLVRQVDPNGKIYIIPSSPELGKVDAGSFGQPLQEIEFVRDFYRTFYSASGVYSNFFDWVIIDTPPAISMFTRLALATSNFIIAPIRLRPSSLRGTGNMINAARTMGALVGEAPKLIGGLVTHWNDDAASNDNLPQYITYFRASQSKLLSTKIPLDVTIEKAANRLASKAFAAYIEVVKEIEEYVNGN